MSRYVIVSVPPAPAPPAVGLDRLPPVPEAGCTWLISAEQRVDDAEEALRAAVREFVTSEAGQRVRQGEGSEMFGWCDALAWIPDEVWEAHGLSVFRHPDVERIILDAEEDLAEELTDNAVAGGHAAGAAAATV